MAVVDANSSKDAMSTASQTSVASPASPASPVSAVSSAAAVEPAAEGHVARPPARDSDMDSEEECMIRAYYTRTVPHGRHAICLPMDDDVEDDEDAGPPSPPSRAAAADGGELTGCGAATHDPLMLIGYLTILHANCDFLN